MKNQEELLVQSFSRPKRDLTPDFTVRVLAEIKAPQARCQKGQFFMKHRLAPVLMGITGILILVTGGAVTYAATDGFTKPFNLNNIFGYQETIEPDGQKVVAIKTSNCSPVDSMANPSDRTMWFRLKKDASITTDQMLSWAQGFCDHLNQPDFYNMIESRLSVNESISWPSIGKIMKKNGNHLQIDTAAYNPSYEGELDDLVIRKDAVILNGESEVNATDLKVGDNVHYLRIDVADPDGAYRPSNQLILLSKVTKNEVYYLDKMMQEKTPQVERVQPCSNDSSHFCSYGYAEDSPEAEVAIAKSFVKQALNDYSKSLLTIDNVEEFRQKRDAFQNRYTTDKLAKYLNGAHQADPIVCAQNTMNEKYSYGSSTFNDNLVTVPIIRTYNQGDNKTITEVFADAVYDVKAGKISSWTCLISMTP